MQRKYSVKLVIAVVAIASLMTCLQSCQKSTAGFTDPSEDFTVNVAAPGNGALLAVGGFIITNNVVIINAGNGAYFAISDLCTYQECTLNYSSTTTQFTCPCHGCIFSQGGIVITGPASVALKTYSVTQNLNILHIQG